MSVRQSGAKPRRADSYRGRRTLISAALAAAAVTVIALPVTGGASTDAKRATKTTSVEDDFFAPDELKVRKNDKVKWVWSDENTNTHNVVLTGKHPKGVKASAYRSGSAVSSFAYKRKFKVPGTYGFVCTYHKTVMKQTVKVKK